jgi:hypothetical protein
VLEGEGRGRYVGTALSIRNPVKAWWGEGDEKVFVDGEAFPGIFGTGTEDYFGYAWCDTKRFTHAFHSQSRCDGPGNRGHTSVNRFHVLDDIPFHRSIRFLMELWHWADCEVGLATVAYWYAAPGFRGALDEAPLAEREVLPVPPVRSLVEGAIEGEEMKLAAVSAGQAGGQDMEGFGSDWSKDAHLWWRGAGVGAELKLEFECAEEGERTLILALTRAPDYGIHRITVNGKALAEEVDLYAEKVAPAGEREFEGVLIRKGANEIVVRVVGTNPKANPKNHMFGLDYLRLKPR